MLQVGENTSVNKAKFIMETNKEIVLQFNPNEYAFSDDVEYRRSSARDRNDKTMQFAGYKPKHLTLTLNFDTSSIVDIKGTSRNTASVKKKTDEIEALAEVDGTLHRPPLVTFLWGEIQFEGVVTSVKTTFTLFNKEGIPIRAKVVVSLQQIGRSEKKPILESPDRTKTRVLSEDVSIWTLAQKEYGDMGEWRRIAKANNILNPFEIETGRLLEIPAIVEEE